MIKFGWSIEFIKLSGKGPNLTDRTIRFITSAKGAKLGKSTNHKRKLSLVDPFIVGWVVVANTLWGGCQPLK